MTPDSAARVCRACSISAGEWGEEIHRRVGGTKADAARERKACGQVARDALADLIEGRLAGAVALGIDPGTQGYIVAVDHAGQPVSSIRLSSLYYDEAPDGPAAAKRWNARILAGLAPKGSRQRNPKAAGRKAVNRLDPSATRFLADALRSAGIPIGIEQCGYRPTVDLYTLVTKTVAAYARGGLQAALAAARKVWAQGESAQSANTTADNYGRLVALFETGPDHIYPPKVWQDSQRTSRATCDRFTEAKRYWVKTGPEGMRATPVPDRPNTAEEREAWNGSMKATKVRSLYVARIRGMDTTKDGEADAFHVANHTRETHVIGVDPARVAV